MTNETDQNTPNTDEILVDSLLGAVIREPEEGDSDFLEDSLEFNPDEEGQGFFNFWKNYLN